MLWWELPSPGSFVTSIVNDLRDGCNVVVYTPCNTPPNLRIAVRQALEHESWCTLSCADMKNDSPLEFLYKLYVPSDECVGRLQSIRDLTQQHAFAGHIIWVESVSNYQWLAWREFLEEYKAVSHGIDLLGRTLFCIDVVGRAVDYLPSEDVCLTIRKYEQAVSSLDMFLYTCNHLQDEAHFNVLGELRTEIIVSLAQWDAVMAEQLTTLSLDELLKPLEWLKRYGIVHGLDSISYAQAKDAWPDGAAFFMCKKWVIHSCVCASTDVDELTHRIWRAQVRVLYPFVEEQRQAIIQRILPYLSVPHTTRFGETIDDVQLLEIGHIEYLLLARSRFPHQDILERIAVLREVRNRLAHLETVTSALIATDAIKKPLTKL